MSDPDLDKLLRSYAERPVPDLVGNLQNTIWEQIRRRNETHESFFDWLSILVWRKYFAASSLAVAAAIGVSFAWLGLNTSQAEAASRALNLQVFSAQSPTLPLTTSFR